jgi:hypothetical protein
MHYKFSDWNEKLRISINDVNILFMIPDKGSDFSLRHHAQTGCGIQSA